MRPVTCAAFMIVAIVALASQAAAREFSAYGDTGWVYASKRDCCNGAIAIAQNNSMVACQESGGVPSPMRGGVQRRGFCQWESAVDANGATAFHCQAQATVPCR